MTFTERALLMEAIVVTAGFVAIGFLIGIGI